MLLALTEECVKDKQNGEAVLILLGALEKAFWKKKKCEYPGEWERSFSWEGGNTCQGTEVRGSLISQIYSCPVAQAKAVNILVLSPSPEL